MTRRQAVIAIFACAVLLRAAAVLAQDSPVVFAHGFNSKHEDWAQTADRLASELTITSYRMTTDWKSTVPNQAGQLQGHPTIGGLNMPIVVGHSVGGLVGREWSKTHPVKGIITLGTPHLGLAVINHAPSYIGFLLELLDRLFNVIPVNLPTENWWVLQIIGPILDYLYGLGADTIVELGAKLWWRAEFPISGQAYPGSAYLRENLNAVSNLNREVVEVPVRIGIVNVARDFFFGGPVRALAPEYADEAAIAYYSAAFALEIYAMRLVATSSPGNTAGITLANRLFGISERIFAIDPFWCATVSTNLPLAAKFCLPNDGIVPFNSQVYPVAGSIRVDHTGPAHTQEKNELAETIAYLLTTFFPIAPRGGQPPPSPPPGGGSCTATASPMAIDLQSTGGTSTIALVTSTADCGWTATSNSGWLTVEAPTSGVGSGIIQVTASANSSSVARSGSINVAGQTIVVNQSGVGCSFELSPDQVTVGRLATNGSITVSTTVADCGWTATSNASWLTVTAPASGTGSGTVQYAVAANNSGAPRTGTLSVAGRAFTVSQNGNAAPIGSIVRPLPESMFQRNVPVDIEATASDPDGNVTVVDFLVDNVLLGSDTSSPYTFVWPSVAGRHTIAARVHDDAGNVTTTAGVQIGVNSLDSVTITPSSLQAGQTATITVTGENPCGALMFNYGDGRVIVDPIVALPYSRTQSWASGGEKIVTVIGQANCVGSVSTSVSVTGNTPPSVSLTSPSDGQQLPAPASVTLAASASDSDGSISRVDFYAGLQLIGSDNAAPYSMVWTNVGSGQYSLTAKAVDNAGAETTSVAIGLTVVDLNTITVTPASPKAGQNATVTVSGSTSCGAVGINYGDGTTIVYALSGLPTTQSHTWTTPGAKTIVATGHGNCQGQISSTVTIAANAMPTVALTSPADGTTVVHPAAVTLSANASDPDGTITRVEFYSSTTLIGSDTTSPYSIAWTPTVGTHSLTARAYDDTNGVTTSAARSLTVTHVGTVSISPSTLVAGQPATVTVSGSSACGAVTINYGDGTAITYALSGLPTSQSHVWSTAGTKTITATGQGNCVGQSSGAVTVSVNTPPTVSLTAPANGSAYTAPATINFQADASDAHGIARVEFYSGSTLLGSDTTAPYTFSWTGVPYGTYSLTARAVDVYGAATVSGAVSVAVRDIVSVSVSPSSTTTGDSGTVTVTGSSTCGAVQIDYGDGTSITYAISGLPFSQAHVWATGGWKLITATGHGNCAGQASTWLYVNWRPSVSLASPINGNTFVGPAAIQINANASDADGAIQYVALYGDGVLLAADTVAPYSFTWTNVPVGSHTIWAGAVDNSGAVNWATAAVSVVDPGPARLTSIVVSPNPIGVGQATSVTVYGTNPCGAVQINFGDGNAPFIPISGVPYGTSYAWGAPGTYTVIATGHGNCSGQVSTTVVVQ